MFSETRRFFTGTLTDLFYLLPDSVCTKMKQMNKTDEYEFMVYIGDENNLIF